MEHQEVAQDVVVETTINSQDVVVETTMNLLPGSTVPAVSQKLDNPFEFSKFSCESTSLLKKIFLAQMWRC